MLKLTNAQETTNSNGGSEHQPVFINVREVFAVVVGNYGHTAILSTGNAYIGVRESAEEVARMVDEARIPGLIRPGNAWTPPEGTSIPDNPYAASVVLLSQEGLKL